MRQKKWYRQLFEVAAKLLCESSRGKIKPRMVKRRNSPYKSHKRPRPTGPIIDFTPEIKPPDFSKCTVSRPDLAFLFDPAFLLALKTKSLRHYHSTAREQVRQVTFEYIEVFYNRIRRHAKISNQAPADFANQFYASKQPFAA